MVESSTEGFVSTIDTEGAPPPSKLPASYQIEQKKTLGLAHASPRRQATFCFFLTTRDITEILSAGVSERWRAHFH